MSDETNTETTSDSTAVTSLPTIETPTDDAVQSARDRDSKAQDGKTSWIYKNINPVMALLLVFLSFSFFFYLLKYLDFTQDPIKKDIAIYLMGSVTTIVTMVVGYYFGSSKGSSDKSKQIEKLTQ